MGSGIDWDQVVEDLGPRIFSYFRRRGYENLASDLTQDVLIRLLEKVETGAFDHEKGSLTQFAFGIARFVGLENRSQVQLEELSEEIPIEHQTQDEYLSQKQKLHWLRVSIATLSADQQEVINLVLEDQLKLEEIADILEMPVGTVKSHVARSKEKIKEHLQEKWEWL